jgi:hypothetical protein
MGGLLATGERGWRRVVDTQVDRYGEMAGTSPATTSQNVSDPCHVIRLAIDSGQVVPDLFARMDVH